MKDELNNYIDMMKEFDYKRNGKKLTIYFLVEMIKYFNNLDEWKE